MLVCNNSEVCYFYSTIMNGGGGGGGGGRESMVWKEAVLPDVMLHGLLCYQQDHAVPSIPTELWQLQ
jgi:hypothetical protein